jgi:hypothetical protein
MTMHSFAEIDKPEVDRETLYADLLIQYREALSQGSMRRLTGVSRRTMNRVRHAARAGKEYQASRAYLYTLAANLAELLKQLDADLTAADTRMGRKHKMRRLDRRPGNPVKAWRR